MKKSILCYSYLSASIQYMHKISFQKLKNIVLDKDTWFLKYYHPEVGKGKFEWDKEFLKYLPQVLKAKDKESLSTIYINWIDSLGTIKVCRNVIQNYFDKNFDLSWFQDTTVLIIQLH
jgi:ABC-type long-subunit fatty acid transport system fused permease/ATPase subunit